MFDKFLGKIVVIEWEQQTVIDWNRDTIDPDNYRDCGFLAKDNLGVYGLVYLPDSYEYKIKNYRLISDIHESDIASLKESSVQYHHSILGSDSLKRMSELGLSFGTSTNPNTTLKMVTNVLQKNCNTCTHSNLLNYVCNKHNKRIQNFTGVCSEWES